MRNFDSTTDPAPNPPEPSVTPGHRRCQVREIGGITAFCECMEEQADECPHVILFGFSRLCHYPEWKNFLR